MLRSFAAAVGFAVAVASGCSLVTQPDPPSVPMLPRLVPLTVIGCGECVGPAQLTPTFLGLTADSVVIIDAAEPRVRQFELDGRLRVGFGINGEGPGELRFPIAAIATDTEIIVHDAFASAAFTHAGEWTRSISLPVRLPNGFDYGPDGSLLLMSIAPPGTGIGAQDSRSLARWSLLENSPVAEVVFESVDLPRAADDPERSFAAAVAIAADGGFVLGEGASYRLFAYDRSGQQVGRVARELERPARSAESVEAERRAFAGTESPRIVKTTWDHFDGYGLDFDSQGRLWVLTSRDRAERGVFDVFASDLSYLGEVELEDELGRGYPLWEVHAGRLAAVTVDAAGHGIVKLWELVEGGD